MKQTNSNYSDHTKHRYLRPFFIKKTLLLFNETNKSQLLCDSFIYYDSKTKETFVLQLIITSLSYKVDVDPFRQKY